MKKSRIATVFMILLLTCLIFTGCAAKKPAVLLPPGAISQVDATAYRVLSDAQASIDSVNSDISSGKLKLTAAQLSDFNRIKIDYNVAEEAGQAYHAGVSNDPAALTKAISQLVIDIGQISSSIQTSATKK